MKGTAPIPINFQKKRPQYSSHFYTKLSSTLRKGVIRKKLSHSAAADVAWSGVKSWTKRIDIFDRDYLLVPINDDLHWSLAVVCHANLLVARARAEPVPEPAPATNSATIVLIDSDDEEPETGPPAGPEDRFPCILFMDSLSMHAQAQVAEVLRLYLECEYTHSGGGVGGPPRLWWWDGRMPCVDSNAFQTRSDC